MLCSKRSLCTYSSAKGAGVTGSSFVLFFLLCHSQGGFLNLGGSIGFILLDTAWTAVSWDGGKAQPQEGGGGGSSSEEASETTPLLSRRAWETLEEKLGRDSELRLLIVVMRVSVIRTTHGKTKCRRVFYFVFQQRRGGTCPSIARMHAIAAVGAPG